MPKFRIQTCNVGDEGDPAKAWWESYDKDIPDARAWAIATVERFNRTLRPYEQARVLLDVEITDEQSTEHRWVKTSLATQIGTHHNKGQLFDVYQCERCGITGKRTMLTQWPPRRDPKFKAKKFEKCSGVRVVEVDA